MNPYRFATYSFTCIFWLMYIYIYMTTKEYSDAISYFPMIKWVMLLFPIPIILMDILITKFAYRDNGD